MYWHELSSLDPFASVRSLQRLDEQAVRGLWRRRARGVPVGQSLEQRGQVVVQAEVPGVERTR